MKENKEYEILASFLLYLMMTRSVECEALLFYLRLSFQDFLEAFNQERVMLQALNYTLYRLPPDKENSLF